MKHEHAVVGTLGGMVLMLSGCPPPKVLPAWHTMQDAVAIVEANRALAVDGLKAHGSVRGRFADDSGARRHFDLEGRLQLVAPDHMRFVLENAFGGEELQIGMNDAKWWLIAHRPDERYFEGARQHDRDRSRAGFARRPEVNAAIDNRRAQPALPLRPESLIECLGLHPLSAPGTAHRVVDDYQQLIFVVQTSQEAQFIEKEYWLDRYEPHLIRRIVFRDRHGRVTLSSDLDAYRAVGERGLLLPHRLRLSWPLDDAELTFRIARWREVPTMTTDHPAFVSPRDRGQRFEFESITRHAAPDSVESARPTDR